MQLLEHHAKDLLRKFYLPVAQGVLVKSGEPTPAVALPVVVKSQVPIGGRGKLGGVQFARTEEELQQAVATILQLDIKGYVPESVLLEPALTIARELYLALRINRDTRQLEYIISSDGGVEIESHTSSASLISADDPGRFNRIATQLQLDEREVHDLLHGLEKAFRALDCLLIEINPLALTTEGALICADAKVMIDDNAQFRQPDLPWSAQSPVKPLGGTIGVIANGAGMAMSTMDTIYAAGGHPANFLDIGGGTGEEVFVQNLSTITRLPGVTSIIINIFAGITRCDDIARGIIAAKQQIPDLPPLFIRLEGTNKSEAAALLSEAGIGMDPDLQTCVTKALEAHA